MNTIDYTIIISEWISSGCTNYIARYLEEHLSGSNEVMNKFLILLIPGTSTDTTWKHLIN